MNGKFVVELTHSQHMALIDLISSSLRCKCDSRLEEFVDCSSSPSVVTTPGQLLRLVSDAHYAGRTVRQLFENLSVSVQSDIYELAPQLHDAIKALPAAVRSG